MAPSLSQERITKRIQLVDAHGSAENSGDTAGIMATFSPTPGWFDRGSGETMDGTDAVHQHYAGLFAAFPDLAIEVTERLIADDAIIEQVIIRGTHKGAWKGIPATNQSVEFPLCSIYRFDDQDRIASETVYYDRVTLLAQLGLLPAFGSAG